jgi:hypothetical protein
MPANINKNNIAVLDAVFSSKVRPSQGEINTHSHLVFIIALIFLEGL